MRRVHQLAACIATMCLMSCFSAFAEGVKSQTYFVVWGIAHVGASLSGTVFVLWLIRRGVKKL